jgi:hypothetical protein
MLLLPVLKSQSAEERFRAAFERLKAGKPEILPHGTRVTQNNVAREAGCDPSALKKARFPALIREIQAYAKVNENQFTTTAQETKRRRAANRTLQERLYDAVRQRDQAQSILISAQVRIIELSVEVQDLRQELDKLRPPLSELGKR